MLKNRKTGLIVSLDTNNKEQAISWKNETSEFSQMIKIGLEFTYSQGFDSVKEVAGNTPLFLDLKLNDIPNTVSSAIRGLHHINPKMLTIHSSGGRDMIEASRKAVDETFSEEDRPLLLAVTVITSMNNESLREIGILSDVKDQVKKLGRMAMDSGADGLICSPHEIELLRDSLGEKPILVVPGIRPTGSPNGDQKRVMTPIEAKKAGADWIVVGRPITRSDNPARMAELIQKELN